MSSKTLKMESLEPRQLLTVGAPDPTFGVNGVATFRHIGALNQLLAEPDGKLLGIGNDLLVQFNSIGSIDTNFGSGGEIAPVFTPVDAAFDSNGNIVIAATYNNDILVIRYNSEGQLDDSFGNDGVAVLDPDPGDTYTAGDVAVQSDDKIVVAGIESAPEAATGELVLSRLDTDSTLDSTFGSNGIVDLLGSQAPSSTKLVALANGNLVVGSSSWLNPVVPALVPAAQVTTVGSSGTVIVSAPEGDGAVIKLIPTGNGDRVIEVFGDEGFGEGASTDGVPDPNFAAFHFGGIYVGAALEGNHLLNLGFDYYSGASRIFAQAISSTSGAPDVSTFPAGAIYPTLNGESMDGYGLAVLSNGDLVLHGTVKGHLALVKLQIADAGATNPTAAIPSIFSFTPPRIGRRYAYVTVQFTQGATPLSTSDLAAHGIDMTCNGNTVTGTLAFAIGGGNGQPVKATYAVKLADHGLNRSSNGVYQFTIAPDAVVDSSGAGNVGEALAAYDLYVPPRNRGAVLYGKVNLMVSDLPTTFFG